MCSCQIAGGSFLWLFNSNRYFVASEFPISLFAPKGVFWPESLVIFQLRFGFLLSAFTLTSAPIRVGAFAIGRSNKSKNFYGDST
jgi:hypothetical protein